MYLLKLFQRNHINHWLLYLHSTMYLLKLVLGYFSTNIAKFTFHYVSIKTFSKKSYKSLASLFTFHYVSIKTYLCCIHCIYNYIFTFHYVSIKTFCNIKGFRIKINLHSTMYLLKLNCIYNS